MRLTRAVVCSWLCSAASPALAGEGPPEPEDEQPSAADAAAVEGTGVPLPAQDPEGGLQPQPVTLLHPPEDDARVPACGADAPPCLLALPHARTRPWDGRTLPRDVTGPSGTWRPTKKGRR